jgi:YbbR domain-containing protein
MIVSPQPKAQMRWQAAFTTNLVPKIISFLLVVVLWGFIGGQPRAEIWLTIPLEYRNMPPTMEIMGEMVNRVEVGIRGPRTLMSSIAPDQLRAHVDLSQALLGLNYVRLGPENIRAPLGTEITKITPLTVRIRLEEVTTRSFPVKSHFIGKLPRELRLKTVGLAPSFIVLQGPVGILKKVREVLTEPVDLSEIKESTKISVGVEIGSSQLRLAPDQPSQVMIDIKVERVR